MAAGPDFHTSEEKKSYSTVFLLAVALLLACSVWAVWQDSFSRHLWKRLKTDFYRLAIDRYNGELEAEDKRLSDIPEYVALTTELEQVRSSLADGEAAREIDRLEQELEKAEIRVIETDLELRVVKSEIEEAWYLLEKAQHDGGSGDAEHQRLADLENKKNELQAAYDGAVKHRDETVAAIAKVKAREGEIEGALRGFHEQRDAISLKLDAVSWEMFGRRVPHVPTVEQLVLPAFERNNFEQWVDRVERCTNCHVAIDRAGFEEDENPMKTHPDRAYYLGNHEKMGCTPCHGGQGASINSVEQAHGFVTFWEDPLLDPRDRAQGKCISCHPSAQGMKGAETVAKGEALFRDLGCHGCHLVDGFGDLPKAGPSLERIAAKVSPEWLVDWIENPKRFRPRTRMPHFFLSRQESVAVAAYLLSTSVPEGNEWLDAHPEPTDVDASTDRVAQGKKLTQSLGCLGCHGFEPEAFASQVAIGMDDAPNLARIAEKTDARWIYHWIRNPRGFSHTARMPRLRLNHDEASAITAYLTTLKTAEKPAPDPALRTALADPKAADEGAKLIRKYGCFGCHGIKGMESESRVSVELSSFADKHTEELFFGDRLDLPATWEAWTGHKILTPRTDETERIEQNMPEFGFDESDARALMIFLGGQSDKKINEKYRPAPAGREAILKRGREVVTYYNCQGCHSFDGQEGAIRRHYEDDIENAPPILVGEGKKLQPEWFFDFLMKPERLRPWLDIRMPTFGLSDEEATAIVDYFAALDGYDLGPVVLEHRQEAHAALALHREQPEEYFDCYSCHPRAQLPEGTYSVATTPLTPAQVEAWMVEHLGIEPSGGAQASAAGDDEPLRAYLGAEGG
jgi:mono/diheme cytochrome c family protein